MRLRVALCVPRNPRRLLPFEVGRFIKAEATPGALWQSLHVHTFSVRWTPVGSLRPGAITGSQSLDSIERLLDSPVADPVGEGRQQRTSEISLLTKRGQSETESNL